jgi:hypothetical protein
MKTGLVLLLAVMLIGTALSVEGWAESKIMARTPNDELPLMDLVFARPIGVMAGIAGTGIFIASLPFTLPTKSVDKAAKMLITDPFRFSFTRPFPDEHLKYD